MNDTRTKASEEKRLAEAAEESAEHAARYLARAERAKYRVVNQRNEDGTVTKGIVVPLPPGFSAEQHGKLKASRVPVTHPPRREPTCAADEAQRLADERAVRRREPRKQPVKLISEGDIPNVPAGMRPHAPDTAGTPIWLDEGADVPRDRIDGW